MKGLHNIRLATFTMPLLLVAIAPAASTQTVRGLEPVHIEAPRVADNGKYYAIVIGINNYPSPLKPLETAVKDATAVATVLTKSYGFQVNLLLNQDATRVNILNAINRFRDRLNENDNLLIYYAGHGYSDHAADKAYWLPIDADSIYSSNRIIADELTTDIRVQNARHVLVISDSCYSGGLSRDADFPTESAGQSVFLNRMLKSRSRTLMASGGDEPVSDSGTDGHSVFAYALLRAFEQQRQSVFTASDLFYGSVRQQVAGKSDQVPQYSVIRNSNHDEGDFVFLTEELSGINRFYGLDQRLLVLGGWLHDSRLRPHVEVNCGTANGRNVHIAYSRATDNCSQTAHRQGANQFEAKLPYARLRTFPIEFVSSSIFFCSIVIA